MKQDKRKSLDSDRNRSKDMANDENIAKFPKHFDLIKAINMRLATSLIAKVEMDSYIREIKYYIRAYNERLPYYAWGNAIFLPILLFGFLADILTIVIFAKNYKKWAKHHVYLFTLAVLELGSIGAVSIPVLHYVASGIFQSKSIYLDMTRNLVLCKVLFTLYFHAKAPSMLMLLMIPIDRLWALHLPFSYRTRTLKTPVAISLFITLGTTAALAIPNVSTQNIVMKFPIGNETFATSVCYTLKYYNFFIFVQSFIVEGMVTTLGLIILNTWIVIKIRMIMSHSRTIVATNQEETKSSKLQKVESSWQCRYYTWFAICPVALPSS